MRIVFMGTPTYASTILEYLANQHDVVAVYTRADAIRGRGKDLVASPVKLLAESLGVVVRTPRTLKDPAVWDELKSYEADVFVVAAYGMILPREVLEIPRLGCLNVHASLLPRWRGAAPVERAILAGDFETGVCVMRMEEGLDTGDWCVRRSVEIADSTAAQLTDDLALLGAQALLTALSQVESGLVKWNIQDDEKAVYAHKIGKHELNIYPTDEAGTALRKVRCAGDAHPSRCIIGSKAVTLLEVSLADKDVPIDPGQVKFEAKRLYLGMKDGALEVACVKPDGKKSMEGKAFAAGLQGVKLGTISWEGLNA